MDKKRQDIAFFLAFCIEQYMNEKRLSHEEAISLFTEFGVLDYLAEHFEILHTQSRQWIIEDIDEYIKERKEK
ncbi:MAG: DUF3791 domain-containing protein [Alistipes sp.]|nr:DUF3791 domain-containing protein [Alistipes sp.]